LHRRSYLHRHQDRQELTKNLTLQPRIKNIFDNIGRYIFRQIPFHPNQTRTRPGLKWQTFITHFVFRRLRAEFFFTKKIRQMKAGQNNK
jgi:hypothetical protein